MPVGPRLSMTDVLTPKPLVSDVLYNMDWQEAPLLRLFGFSRANLKKVSVNGMMATQINWRQDTNSPTATVLAAPVAIIDATITLAVGTGQFFRQGDLIGICAAPVGTQPAQVAEYVLATGPAVADVLPVIRGVDPALPAAIHAAGVAVLALSRAMPEFSEYTTGHTTTVTNEFNVVQILSQAVSVSGTTMAIEEYGVADRLSYEIAKVFNNGGSAGVLAQRLANTFYHGVRVVRDGVVGTPGEYGLMGGYDTFVTLALAGAGHIVDLGGLPIQRMNIHDMLRVIRRDGGACTHLLGGGWLMEKITAMYEGTIVTEREETVGGAEIKTILTPHGKLRLVYDWMCPEDRAFFINPAKMGWVPLRDFEVKKIQETHDGYSTDIVGEFTFVLNGPRNFGVINNIDVDA